MLKSSYNLMDFAQIRLRSVENMMGFTQIRQQFGVFLLRSREFCKNQVTIWCFLLRSGDFCTNPTKIEKYSHRQNGIFGSIIVGFDRSDRRSNNSDPTWPVGVCGRRRVFLLETWCHLVDSELGTNPTRPNLWTPLVPVHLTKARDRLE